MSKLDLTIRIGGSSRTYDLRSGGNQAADSVASMVLDYVAREGHKEADVKVSQLAKNLPKVVENSYMNAVRFAATGMIGTKSPLTVKTTSPPVQIRDPDGEGLTIANWPVLSTRTIREQNEIRGSKGQAEFFSRTGALRMNLLGMARNIVKRTGVVRVTHAGRLRDARGRFVSLANAPKSISVGQLTIRLLPNIPRTALPGLVNMDLAAHDSSMTFERRLGFSPSALQKLKGASKGKFTIPGTHRPLLQPAFTYWTLNRIPQVIARSISSALPKQARIRSDSGLSEYSAPVSR